MFLKISQNSQVNTCIGVFFSSSSFFTEYLRWLLQCIPYYLVLQKQPSRGVYKKRCCENIQQIYRRTPMPKCDFNKIALLFLRTPLDGCFWYHFETSQHDCLFLSFLYIAWENKVNNLNWYLFCSKFCGLKCCFCLILFLIFVSKNIDVLVKTERKSIIFNKKESLQ